MKITNWYLASCSHVCSRNKGVWGSRNCKYVTWSTSNGMHRQIEWTVMWLWKISSTLIPCSYAIAACAFCNLNYDDFVHLVHKLENIFKVDQHHFRSLGSEDTWPQYLGSHFMSDLSKHNRHQASRLLLEYIMRWTNQLVYFVFKN